MSALCQGEIVGLVVDDELVIAVETVEIDAAVGADGGGELCVPGVEVIAAVGGVGAIAEEPLIALTGGSDGPSRGRTKVSGNVVESGGGGEQLTRISPTRTRARLFTSSFRINF